MSLSKRQLVRIGNAVRDQLLRLKENRQWQVPGKLAGVVRSRRWIEGILRKLKLCEGRAWRGAAKRLISQIAPGLREIPHHVRELELVVQACRVNVPRVSDIYKELLQADEEFGQLRYYTENDVLAVSTDLIELEGIQLGCFEIQLQLASLADIQSYNVYRVVALDPHPAASNELVTHPHVNDERLCAGDAGAVINMSLTTGRICDFFLLVRSVLTHYNPDSPYVALEKWHGVPCYECGFVASEEDVYWCISCENSLCSECSSYCRKCEETVCLACLETCGACEELICSSCMARCPNCDRPICVTCQKEQQCPCIEENEENQNDSENAEGKEEAEAEQPEANAIEAA